MYLLWDTECIYQKPYLCLLEVQTATGHTLSSENYNCGNELLGGKTYNPLHFYIAYNSSKPVLCGASISISDSHEKQYLSHFHPQIYLRLRAAHMDKILLSGCVSESALEFWGWLKWSSSSSTLSVCPNLWRMPHTWGILNLNGGKYEFVLNLWRGQVCLHLARA